MVGTGQRLKSEHICPGSVEREKNVDPLAEVFLKFCDSRPCVIVVAIGANMAAVGARNRRENLWMHSGIVIAGKTTTGPAFSLWHLLTM